MKRFPNLDALRFFAAAVVVIGHTEQKKGYLGLKSYFAQFPELFQTSELAVTFFFVLSGFLITYLIVTDLEKNRFSLKLFYKKRVFRIWPLYYLIIILGLFVIPNIPFLEYHTPHIGNINEIPTDVAFQVKVAYLTFVPHVALFFDTISYVSHTWSIGAEEQFYLIWPVLLIFFYRHSLRLSLLSIIFLASLKFIAHQQGWNVLAAYLEISRMHAMIVGGLFAMMYHKSNLDSVKGFYLFFTTRWTEILAILGVIIVFYTHVQLGSYKHDIFSIVSGLIILNAATKSTTFIRLENSKSLSYLGKISYGIYMYHPFVLGVLLHAAHRYTDIYFASLKSNLGLYLIVLLITIAVSAASFELVEKRLVKKARN